MQVLFTPTKGRANRQCPFQIHHLKFHSSHRAGLLRLCRHQPVVQTHLNPVSQINDLRIPINLKWFCRNENETYNLLEARENITI